MRQVEVDENTHNKKRHNLKILQTPDFPWVCISTPSRYHITTTTSPPPPPHLRLWSPLQRAQRVSKHKSRGDPPGGNSSIKNHTASWAFKPVLGTTHTHTHTHTHHRHHWNWRGQERSWSRINYKEGSGGIRGILSSPRKKRGHWFNCSTELRYTYCHVQPVLNGLVDKDTWAQYTDRLTCTIRPYYPGSRGSNTFRYTPCRNSREEASSGQDR